jgi:hypothetical protein
MRNFKEKIKKHGRKIEKEVRGKTFDYVLAALGLVAALAWNDAMKGVIEYFFPFSKDTILIKFIYAVLITIMIVIISVYLKILLRGEDQEINK